MKKKDWSDSLDMGDSFTMDKLRGDFRTLANDMEQLLAATASETGQQVAQVRARAQESLKAAKACMLDAHESAMAKARVAGRATDDYVRENPWQVLAIAGAVGLLCGLLLARSDSDS